ncbi:MAG: TauD/TfdA family dioxygenase [Alphaproteobacteria bacterium]|nr:TauD/TfdA family dioxygenase [Alphaproteobacteria bacterium]
MRSTSATALWARRAKPTPGYENESVKRRARKRQELDAKFRHSDFIIAGIADLLHCKIWSRYENGPFARNILTDPGEQQSSDLDNVDMALRFAQSTVEKNLPDTPIPRNDESCAYRIYLCIKNWARIPIYLITVSEIVEEYLCRHSPERKAKILEILQSSQFVRRGPQFDGNQTLISTDVLEKCPILKKDFLRPDGWIMAFDHERVRPMAEAPEQEVALLELREAIRRARRDAIKIVMQPGDLLVVDNLRAMVSRRDYLPSRLAEVLRLIPAYLRITRDRPDETDPDAQIRTIVFWPLRPHRWLRAYYAFRHAHSA